MIFRNPSKFPISSWVDILPNETAFIMGNGPSLLEIDHKDLDGLFTIGINRSYKLVIPTILLWQDESLYDDCFDEVRFVASAKVTRKEIDPDNLFTHFSLEPGAFRFHKTPHKLFGGGCTGVLAAQLAYAMGCTSIVLLGCDCKYKDGKTDFYGVNKHHSDTTLNNFSAAMEWLSRECPVPIYNCGDASFWPKITLEEAIEKTKPTKMNHLLRLNRLKGKDRND